MKISVQGYSGFKRNERPIRFLLDGHEYDVKEILDQWYAPEATFFKVLASDGNHYILRYDSDADDWSLESYRRPADAEQKDV